MAIPVFLWLKDDSGNAIKVLMEVQDRENSIELITQNHYMQVPVDTVTSKQSAIREYGAYVFTKEADSYSVHLFKTTSTEQMLKFAECKFFHFNHAGQEEAYLPPQLESIRVTAHKGLLTIERELGGGDLYGRSLFRKHSENIHGVPGWVSGGCNIMRHHPRWRVTNSTDTVLDVIQ